MLFQYCLPFVQFSSSVIEIKNIYIIIIIVQSGKTAIDLAKSEDIKFLISQHKGNNIHFD